MKQEYIEIINKQMQDCDDMSLLDLVSRLLEKSSNAEGRKNERNN